MNQSLKKKVGRITPRTRDEFLYWVRKKNALKTRTTEQLMQAKALAIWADDGGQYVTKPSEADRKL
jgi:hypothetical protein